MSRAILLPWLTKLRFKADAFNDMWPPHVYATVGTNEYHTKYLQLCQLGMSTICIRVSRIVDTTKVVMGVGNHNYRCFH